MQTTAVLVINIAIHFRSGVRPFTLVAKNVVDLLATRLRDLLTNLTVDYLCINIAALAATKGMLHQKIT